MVLVVFSAYAGPKLVKETSSRTLKIELGITKVCVKCTVNLKKPTELKIQVYILSHA